MNFSEGGVKKSFAYGIRLYTVRGQARDSILSDEPTRRDVREAPNGGRYPRRDDRLVLHDSPGNDVLVAKSHKVQLFSSSAEAQAHSLIARNFRNVMVTADRGGDKDVAKLHDSILDTLWEAAWLEGKTWSKMTCSSRQLYEVFAFEHVTGYSHEGGRSTLKKDAAVDFILEWGIWDPWTEGA